MQHGRGRRRSRQDVEDDESYENEEMEEEDIELVDIPRRRKKKKSNRRGFSDVTWYEACRLLRISTDPVIGDILPMLDEVDLSEVVGQVLLLWNLRSRRIPFPGRNEREREDYVKMVIDCMPDISGLKMGLEKRIRIDDFGGPLDIVLYADTPTAMPMIYIVEAKKDDLLQGRAQLYLQLKVCHEVAVKEENWNHPIYGATTTADRWVFVRYDGKEFVEAQKIGIDHLGDRDGIEAVVAAVFSILQYQAAAIQEVIERFAEEKKEKDK